MTERRMYVDALSWYGIVLAATFPKAIGITQGIMARETGRGIWAATILAIVAGSLLLAVVGLVLKGLKADLSSELARLAGPWIARPAALVEAAFHILLYLAGTYTFVGHAKYFFLYETPMVVFQVAVALLAVANRAIWPRTAWGI